MKQSSSTLRGPCRQGDAGASMGPATTGRTSLIACYLGPSGAHTCCSSLALARFPWCPYVTVLGLNQGREESSSCIADMSSTSTDLPPNISCLGRVVFSSLIPAYFWIAALGRAARQGAKENSQDLDVY